MTAIDTSTSIEGMSESVSTSTEPAVQAPPALAGFVPNEYKEKDWVKGVKDVPSFFKMFEDQKTALSRRPAGIPQENAAPEEWESFHKALGVPDKPEEYEFKIDGKEFTDQDKAFHNALRPILKEAGISQRSLNRLAPAFDKALQDLAGDSTKSQEETDAEFDKLASEKFGKERDAVFERAKKFFKENIPEDMQPNWDGLSNQNLIALATFTDQVYRKYISEDNIPSGQSPPATSLEDKKAEGRKLMASPAYSDGMHPDHERVVRQVQELYSTFNRI